MGVHHIIFKGKVGEKQPHQVWVKIPNQVQKFLKLLMLEHPLHILEIFLL